MFTNIIGNQNIKNILKFKIEASRQQNKALSHILFEGPPGTGKTSFAKAIAREMNAEFISVTPKLVQQPKDLIRIISRFSREGYDAEGNIVGRIKPTVVFIDEVHALKPEIQELLGIVIEEFEISSVIGEQIFRQKVPLFTLIGATTLAGTLTKPFRERFKLSLKLKSYSIEESTEIALLHAKRLSAEVEHPAASEIARRSKGIPRLIVSHLENIADYASIHFRELGAITEHVVEKAFELFAIDSLGLDSVDRKVVWCLADNADKPVGVESLALQTNEAIETIIHVVEPYLMSIGFIQRTPRGRKITDKGMAYLKRRDKQQSSGPSSHQTPLAQKEGYSNVAS